MNAHNTFENPNKVVPQHFDGASITDNKIKVLLPAMSVVALEVV